MAHLDVGSGTIVAKASESEHSAFIRRTYAHLGLAILAFAGVETVLIQSGIAESFTQFLSGSRWMWFVILAAFMGVSYFADNWARSSVSRETQYLGLGVFVLAEAIIFMPLIYMALRFAPDVIPQAGLMTLALSAGITFTAFTTRKNFSFLGPMLSIGGLVALGFIAAAMIFGFSLGWVFSAVMIVFAMASILYTTSNIIHEYHTDQHVAASLSLFASVALLFWYLVQFLMAFTGGDD